MEDVYERLRRAFDAKGVGYAKTEQGAEYEFLKRFFTEEDAEYVIAFPHGYQTAADLAEAMGKDEDEVAAHLADMASRGLIFRARDAEGVKYHSVPIAHGVFEFQLKNVEPQWSSAMSKHYLQGWGKQFYGSDEPFFRAIPVRAEVTNDAAVMPYDDVDEILSSRRVITVSDCMCRKREEARGKPCGHPFETCLQFDAMAEFYLENGWARETSLDEARAIVREGEKLGLVVQVSNSKDTEAMCICCSCACGLLGAIKYFPGPATAKVGNYVCVRDEGACRDSCSHVCAKRCPVGAFKTDGEGNLSYRPERCIGCGLCVSTCPGKALVLQRKTKAYEPHDTLFDTYDVIARSRIGAERACDR